MKTLGNPLFTLKDCGEFDGEYELDICITHPNFEGLLIALSFNEKGEYLASYDDDYIGLFPNRETAIRELFVHISLESLQRGIALKQITEIAKLHEK